MPKTVRVNIRSVANVAAVRKEKRNGRDVVIVPSATLPDGVVMNDILYPADEIAKSFAGLERTPAPLGHPMINGAYVSARDPEGINVGWVGAWNENLRRENGRVFLDKVIDVDTANRTEGGKRVLEAIEAGKPIHTSTGLLAQLEGANGDVPYKFIARNMEFDHDAILLDENGAATPDQGVGMMVNAKGEEIEVINSFIEDADREMDWAVESLARALERKSKASVMERMKTAIMEAIGLSERATPTTNKKDDDMDQVQFDALSAKVDALSEAIKPDALATAIGNAVAAAVKPLTEAHEAVIANQKAKDEEELKGLREKIVKANLLDEAAAGELTLNAARALAKKAEPGKAAALNGAFKPGGDDKPSFKLPKAEG